MEQILILLWIVGLSVIGIGSLLMDLVIGESHSHSFKVHSIKPEKTFQESYMIQDDYDNVDSYIEYDNQIEKSESLIAESDIIDDSSFKDDFDFNH